MVDGTLERMLEMTAAAARRTAVAAQGFTDRAPVSRRTRRHVLGVVDRTGLLQLDSVSVAVRAHYMPVFSRIGCYDRDLLDNAAWRDTAAKPRALVEYWAHEAALIPVGDWPLMRWRMRRYEGGRGSAASSNGTRHSGGTSSPSSPSSVPCRRARSSGTCASRATAAADRGGAAATRR